MPSISEIEKKEAEVLSAVFESEEKGRVSRYFIYKLDHHSSASAVGATAASLPDFGQPILTLDPSNPNNPPDVKIARNMIVFSQGSRIYFVGGFDSDFQYQEGAFFLDLSSTSTSPSGTTIINPPVAIQPMKSPKPFPWSFGPIGYYFYIISASESECSFESLNLRTNTWVSLPLPDSDPVIKRYFKYRFYEHDRCLRIKATAVMDSNICISTVRGPLFVYFTKTQTWRLINWPVVNKYGCLSLPYDGAAVPLIVGNKQLFFNLGSSLTDFEIYECPYPPLDESFEMTGVDFHTDPGIVTPIANVFGLEEHLKNLGRYELDEKPEMPFWSFDNKPGRICIVHLRYSDSLIHFCDFGLVEGEEVRAKVVNAVTYKHRSYKHMVPRLFLFVKGTSSTPSASNAGE